MQDELLFAGRFVAALFQLEHTSTKSWYSQLTNNNTFILCVFYSSDETANYF